LDLIQYYEKQSKLRGGHAWRDRAREGNYEAKYG
jgi:hypothetical protein